MSGSVGDGMQASGSLDVQTQAGNDLLRKLGSAYYAERRGDGTSDNTQSALDALDAHISTHGDGFLQS